MSGPSRVLVLGASGMLGSAVVAEFAAAGFTVVAAARRMLPLPPGVTGVSTGDLATAGELERVISVASPEVVLNCAGLVKQRDAGSDPVAAIAMNAMLPHRLAALCGQHGARLVHVGTDCIYSGAAQGQRGAQGYRETDPPDATDLYGRSKLLGEVAGAGCVTLRMSLIGREPSGSRHGLVEWFLAACPPLHGFARALFTGVTTPVAARLLAQVVREQPTLEGIWHVAAAPISKLALLQAIAERVRPDLAIQPLDEPFIDRRLDGSRFAARVGWQAPPWPAMLDEMLAIRKCVP